MLIAAPLGACERTRSAMTAQDRLAVQGIEIRETHPLALRTGEAPDSLFEPDAIAQAMLAARRQPRNAWSWEITLRPRVETF